MKLFTSTTFALLLWTSISAGAADSFSSPNSKRSRATSTRAFSASAIEEEASPASAPTAAAAASSSLWENVEQGPPDAILGIAQAFRACADERKVNVCVGAYRDAHGQPWVLPSVRAAERIMLETTNENKEYLPIEGDVAFIDKALLFAYGSDMNVKDCVAGVQTLSGTGACRIGGEFLAKFYPGHSIYIPTPTW
jgi:aspartate aminotransferase, mitochondrial